MGGWRKLLSIHLGQCSLLHQAASLGAGALPTVSALTQHQGHITASV
jgi:hypothetical protein